MADLTDPRRFFRFLPKWTIEQPADRRVHRAVAAEYPPFYKEYAGYLRLCPKLWRKLEERFQMIMDSLNLPIELIVFELTEEGISFKIEPGSAVAICPSSSGTRLGYESHNVDRDDYCLVLYLLLGTALQEIYEQIFIWSYEESPTRDVDPTYKGRPIHITRKEVKRNGTDSP